MTVTPEIRASRQGDLDAIEALYPEAFPDEDLLPLVTDLLQQPGFALSLVGVVGSSLAGHVIFTRCGLAQRQAEMALLGPLAVAPALQRRGIGSALVRAGLKQMTEVGVRQVCVLGDPAYYGRLGFREESHVMPPYDLPPEWRGAWQSISLDQVEPPLEGKLAVPEPWRRSELWLP